MQLILVTVVSKAEVCTSVTGCRHEEKREGKVFRKVLKSHCAYTVFRWQLSCNNY